MTTLEHLKILQAYRKKRRLADGARPIATCIYCQNYTIIPKCPVCNKVYAGYGLPSSLPAPPKVSTPKTLQ